MADQNRREVIPGRNRLVDDLIGRIGSPENDVRSAARALVDRDSAAADAAAQVEYDRVMALQGGAKRRRANPPEASAQSVGAVPALEDRAPALEGGGGGGGSSSSLALVPVGALGQGQVDRANQETALVTAGGGYGGQHVAPSEGNIAQRGQNLFRRADGTFHVPPQIERNMAILRNQQVLHSIAAGADRDRMTANLNPNAEPYDYAKAQREGHGPELEPLEGRPGFQRGRQRQGQLAIEDRGQLLLEDQQSGQQAVAQGQAGEAAAAEVQDQQMADRGPSASASASASGVRGRVGTQDLAETGRAGREAAAAQSRGNARNQLIAARRGQNAAQQGPPAPPAAPSASPAAPSPAAPVIAPASFVFPSYPPPPILPPPPPPPSAASAAAAAPSQPVMPPANRMAEMIQAQRAAAVDARNAQAAPAAQSGSNPGRFVFPSYPPPPILPPPPPPPSAAQALPPAPAPVGAMVGASALDPPLQAGGLGEVEETKEAEQQAGAGIDARANMAQRTEADKQRKRAEIAQGFNQFMGQFSQHSLVQPLDAGQRAALFAMHRYKDVNQIIRRAERKLDKAMKQHDRIMASGSEEDKREFLQIVGDLEAQVLKAYDYQDDFISILGPIPVQYQNMEDPFHPREEEEDEEGKMPEAGGGGGQQRKRAAPLAGGGMAPMALMDDDDGVPPRQPGNVMDPDYRGIPAQAPGMPNPGYDAAQPAGGGQGGGQNMYSDNGGSNHSLTDSEDSSYPYPIVHAAAVQKMLAAQPYGRLKKYISNYLPEYIRTASPPESAQISKLVSLTASMIHVVSSFYGISKAKYTARAGLKLVWLEFSELKDLMVGYLVRTSPLIGSSSSQGGAFQKLLGQASFAQMDKGKARKLPEAEIHYDTYLQKGPQGNLAPIQPIEGVVAKAKYKLF